MLGPPSPDGVQRRRRRNPSGDATNNVIIPALGFAFVNFITPRGVPNFYEEFHGHPLTESSANRRVEIIFADVQGKEENLRESARYRPACFVSDGSHRREM